MEIGWRQWAGAWYAQDAMSLRPQPDRDARNPPRNSITAGTLRTGWRRISLFGSNGVLLTQPVVGTSVYSENNARFLFGPRVGIAWAPLGSQTKTTIHAGFGLYYEQLDYMGNCCDAAPIGSLNFKVTVSPTTFPIHLAAGQPIPGAKVSPSGSTT